MDVKGDTVAIVIGDSWSDVVLMKSTNNGNTWAKTLIYHFPYTLFSEKTTLVKDTPYTSDGNTEVLIDKKGNAHVWYGNTRVLNTHINDDTLHFLAGTNGLLYWSDIDSVLKIIGGALDLDGNGEITLPVKTGYYFPTYYCGLSSMASAGIDTAGVIYVVYSVFMETFVSPKLQNYRHLYVKKSTDRGKNWSAPNDITPSTDDSYREYVYPSMAKHVDQFIHIVAEEDSEPGLSVTEESDPFNVNSIMYLKVSTALNVAVEKITFNNNNSVSIYPNPVSENQVQISVETGKSTELQVSVYDIIGKKISGQYFGRKDAGLHQLSISTENLTSGIYLIEVNAGDSKTTKQLIVKQD